MKVKSFLFVFCLCFVVTSRSAWAVDSSSQFFTKAYTEGLGRVPDSKAQNYLLSFFSNNGCNVSSVSNIVSLVSLSNEFLDDYTDSGSRLAGLYRIALNREVDSATFSTVVPELNSGKLNWNDVVSDVSGSSEFTNLVNNVICVAPPANQSGSYGWFGGNIFDRSGGSMSNTFNGSTGSQLQTALNATGPGGTVYLKPGSIVQVSSQLTIPVGVTLTTLGNPEPTQYLLMSRIVRESSFAGNMIEVQSGAVVQNVWIDGNRSNLDNSGSYCADRSCFNIGLYGGSGTSISNNKMTDSDGGTNLQTLGSYENVSCGSSAAIQVTGNLVTQYATAHYASSQQPSQPWSDGLTIECENANVSANTIVDATDGGIVFFSSASSTRTSITQNIIYNSGNSAFYGIVVETRPTQPANGDGWTCTQDNGQTYDFSQASIKSNEIYTSPNAFIDFGILLGTRPLYQTACNGSGILLQGNTTAGQTLNANAGIVVSGMHYATVSQNGLLLAISQHDGCPAGNAIDDPTYGFGLNTDIPFSSQSDHACLSSNQSAY